MILNLYKTLTAEQQRIRFTLYMNYLAVVYAFLIPVSQRAMSAVFVTILLLFILRGQFKYYLSNSFNNRIVQACLLFWLVHIIWLLGSENLASAKSIIDDMKYLIYPLIFLSFVDKRFSFFIIISFVLGMLYSEVISYFIHFNLLPFRLDISDFNLYKTQQVGNPTPFLDHARYNVLLSIVLGITLYNLLKKNGQYLIRVLSLFFIIASAINITLVGGRIGYITFVCIMITTVFLLYRTKAIKLMVPTILIILSFFYFSYNTSFILKEKVSTTLSSVEKLFQENPDYNTSMGYRIVFWIHSLEVIQNNVLFGVGTGDLMDEVRNSAPEKYKKEVSYVSHPHNEYIKNFLQFGLVGFLVFLNIFYQIFISKIEDKTKKSILVITTIGIMIGMLTSILGSKVYLTLLVIMIAATTTKNDYLSDQILFNNFKKYIYFCVLVIFYLIIAVVQ